MALAADLEEQAFLRCVVDIDGCRTHPGTGGDISRRRGSEPLFGECLDGSGQEPVSGIGGAGWVDRFTGHWWTACRRDGMLSKRLLSKSRALRASLLHVPAGVRTESQA